MLALPRRNSVPATSDRAITAAAVATVTDPLELFSYNGALMTANGSRFYLKGLNWFGKSQAEWTL